MKQELIVSRDSFGIKPLYVHRSKDNTFAFSSSVKALKETIELYKSKKLKVCVGGVYSVSEIDKAHDLLESGNSTGKISVKWV